jgi:membrane protein YqaA with SNARE-associated domain
MRFMQNWLDRLWDVAATKGATGVLVFVAFTESVFFPVPPDLMLIPMCLADRTKAFRLAAICLAASLLGGAVGYFVGYWFMDLLGMPIVRFYGLLDKYGTIQAWYDTYSAWAVGVAGLTPIPYKVCTLTAGAFKINFPIFILASAASRGFRFFLVAALAYRFGDDVREFMERRLNLLVAATTILVVLGFVALKFV